MMLVGSPTVGKTSIWLRYVDNVFSDTYIKTTEAFFKIKNIKVGEHKVKLQIWDQPPQDRFKEYNYNKYRGAHGIIVVYDVTNQESFQNVKKWLQEINYYASKNVCKVLVGNKCDRVDRKVTTQEAKELAGQLNMSFLETSAKNDNNVEEAFCKMACCICRTAKIWLKEDINSWPKSHGLFGLEQKQVVEGVCLIIGIYVSRDVTVYCVKTILRLMELKQKY
uniref:Uncharacterized protein n=1 Tax=Arcella intermedia TaxID=1963864 RepID=A0A6B2LHD0_9EUKA